MKKYTGFMIVHKSKWLKWFRPSIRVCVQTFNDVLDNNEQWPSFQTVEPGIEYAVNVKSVQIYEYDWLYKVVLMDRYSCVIQPKVTHILCAKQI